MNCILTTNASGLTIVILITLTLQNTEMDHVQNPINPNILVISYSYI